MDINTLNGWNDDLKSIMKWLSDEKRNELLEMLKQDKKEREVATREALHWNKEAILKDLRENHVKILLGSTIADTGLSITNLSVLILAGGGKSSTRAFQRIGRIQRKYPGKSVAFVYDFFDEHPTLRKHSQLRYDLMSIEPEFKQEIKSFNEFC